MKENQATEKNEPSPLCTCQATEKTYNCSGSKFLTERELVNTPDQNAEKCRKRFFGSWIPLSGAMEESVSSLIIGY